MKSPIEQNDLSLAMQTGLAGGIVCISKMIGLAAAWTRTALARPITLPGGAYSCSTQMPAKAVDSLLAVSNGKYMKNSVTVKNLWPIVITFLAITAWGADDFPVLHWTEVDENIIAPMWRGNDEKGSLIAPL